MPVYEYECKCGNKFEALKSIEDRDKVVCSCGEVARLKMSRVSLFIIAAPFKVYDSDGVLIHEKQAYENSPTAGYRHENPNLVEA